MKIAIVGAGFTGLTAAWRLSHKGHQVTVFEKEKIIGGLAAGFRLKDWQWSLEYFYHHLFPSDQAARKLISEIGSGQKLITAKPKTSIFYKDKISQFDSPFSLLLFPYLSFLEKIRAGAVTTYLKLAPNWKVFEKVTASEWLAKFYGKRTYQILWQPLLKAKFGDYFEKISMAWFWARIKKRSNKLFYPEGGFQSLLESLTLKTKEYGGEIILDYEVKNLKDLQNFDKIIITTPTNTFLKIAPFLPKNYQEKIRKLVMIGALNLLLVLKESFLKDGTYWLNINQPGFPYVAVVEQTNFIDKKYYGHNHLLYVGGYYPQNHRYFKMSKEQLLQEFLPSLSRINPSFNLKENLLDSFLFTNLYGQPIIPVNYSQIIPPYQTPLPNVYLANIQQVYPWDRETNYAIWEGGKIAKLIE